MLVNPNYKGHRLPDYVRRDAHAHMHANTADMSHIITSAVAIKKLMGLVHAYVCRNSIIKVDNLLLKLLTRTMFTSAI